MATPLCDYCGHPLAAAATGCEHCGARTPRTELSSIAAELPKLAERAAVEVAPALESGAGGAAALAAGLLAQPQRWLAGAASALVMALLALTASCHFFGPHPAASGDPTNLLPAALRLGASCTAYDTARHTDRCVVAAGSPLLMGIDDGQGVTFYAEALPHDRLSAVVQQWRAGGGTVLADNAVFASISPARNVLYADTRTGLRIDTDTFPDSQSAQTFLTRCRLAS